MISYLTMKKNVLVAIMFLPIVAMAQSNWELPQKKQVEVAESKSDTQKVRKKVKAQNDINDKTYTIKEEDRPYLKGAVPEVDGKVTYTFTIDVPGKTAAEVYDIVYDRLEKFTNTDKHTEASHVAIVNKEEKSIIATCKEWLIFTDKLLLLDRTKFNYVIIADCEAGKVSMTIQRLTYEYANQRNVEFMTAEDLITDRKTLANNGMKLKKTNSKFRKKTIDRVKEIMQYFQDTIH